MIHASVAFAEGPLKALSEWNDSEVSWIDPFVCRDLPKLRIHHSESGSWPLDSASAKARGVSPVWVVPSPR
jgi:hypothetical protein